MANTLPNTGVEVWNDTTDLNNSMRAWYNMLSGLTNSNMYKLDGAFGAPLSSLGTSSKTVVGSINEVNGKANTLDINTIQKRTTIENVNIIDYFKNVGTKAGIYYVNANCTGQPVAGKYYIVTFERSPVGSDFRLSATEFGSEALNYVGDCWNTVWSGWKQLATTSKTDILPQNGWVNYGGSYGTKSTISRSGNIVSIDAFIKDGVKTTDAILFNIPAEYRPEFIKYQSCNVYPIQTGLQATIEVKTDGRVTLTNIPQNATALAIYIQYSI
ncbi:MAG: hypothetical protein ACRDD8_02590, partial [Bacteroidales bacterium]